MQKGQEEIGEWEKGRDEKEGRGRHAMQAQNRRSWGGFRGRRTMFSRSQSGKGEVHVTTVPILPAMQSCHVSGHVTQKCCGGHATPSTMPCMSNGEYNAAWKVEEMKSVFQQNMQKAMSQMHAHSTCTMPKNA